MALSDPMPSYICPSAHSLWRVPELVAEVMDHLSQRDLSVCARVSKGVSHYALGSLYKTGVSIQHVLNILAPVHLVSSPAPNVKYKEMNFLRSPGSNDWDNFYQYARRVRSLSCIDLDASDQLFLDISSVLPAGTLLFPHLRSLEWKINSPRLRAHVDFFMGDALSDVAISGPLDFLSTTLGLLSQRSPAIRRLSLHVSALEDSPTPAAVMQDIMTSIKAFKGLEHLQMSPQLAPAAAVPFLSRLPRLTTLYLRPFQLTTAFLFGDTFRYTVPRLKALDSDFQCLKDLICEVGLLLAGVSPSLSALSLQKLHVAINPTNTEADLAQLGCLLRDNCKTLTYIMIIFDTPTLLPAESSPITRSVLKLFLGIRLLRHLNIDDVRPARLSCAELEELAPMCRKLTFLGLCARSRWNGASPESLLSLGSLITLAENCHSLLSLGLALDITTPVPDLPPNPPVFRRLQILYMDYSTKIEDPAAVAVYLSRLLPPDARLEPPPSRFTSAHIRAVEAANIKGWKDVSHFLDAMKPLRNIVALHLKSQSPQIT